jgi:outer membrane protein assembly factor BamB
VRAELATGAKHWAAHLVSDVQAMSLSIANGVVYLGSFSGAGVYAVSAKTGARLWHYPHPDGGITATAVAGGMLYFVSGGLYALGLK